LSAKKVVNKETGRTLRKYNKLIDFDGQVSTEKLQKANESEGEEEEQKMHSLMPESGIQTG